MWKFLVYKACYVHVTLSVCSGCLLTPNFGVSRKVSIQVFVTFKSYIFGVFAFQRILVRCLHRYTTGAQKKLVFPKYCIVHIDLLFPSHWQTWLQNVQKTNNWKMFVWPPFFVINVSKIGTTLFFSLFLLPFSLIFTDWPLWSCLSQSPNNPYFLGGDLSPNDPLTL